MERASKWQKKWNEEGEDKTGVDRTGGIGGDITFSCWDFLDFLSLRLRNRLMPLIVRGFGKESNPGDMTMRAGGLLLSLP